MTIDELKTAIPKLQALADGKEIQMRERVAFPGAVADWRHMSHNISDSTFIILTPFKYDTRIKPEAKYRPWTVDEVPVGKVLKCKKGTGRFLIVRCDAHGLGSVFGNDSYADAFEKYIMDDGSVCGVAVES